MKINFQERDKVFMYSNLLFTLFCGVYGFNNIDKLSYIDVNKSIVSNNIAIKESQNIILENNLANKDSNTVSVTKVSSEVNRKVVNTNYKESIYDGDLGKEIVNYAQTFLKLPYVMGGYSLTKGTDCSGFTKLIFSNFGINISRSVVEQSRQGSFVRKSDLKPGDLVFYGYNDGRVHHVGIYMGNGKVIHESNPKSGVKISSVNMMEYITARRVLTSSSINNYHDLVDKKEESNDSVTDSSKVTNDINDVIDDSETVDSNEVVDNKDVINNETNDNKDIINDEIIDSNDNVDNNVSDEVINDNSTSNE